MSKILSTTILQQLGTRFTQRLYPAVIQLSKTVVSVHLSSPAAVKQFSTSSNRRDLREFFDEEKNLGEPKEQFLLQNL